MKHTVTKHKKADTTSLAYIPVTLLVMIGSLVLVDWNLRFLVAVVLGASPFVVTWALLCGKKLPRDSPHKFLSSGRTPAASYSRKLILRRSGGKGTSYWGDPEVAFASLSDFAFKEGPRVDFAKLLEEKYEVIAPYCVDDERRQIIFVEVESGFDPASPELPFFFQAQRNHAIALYAIPFDEYIRVSKQLSNTHTKNVLLVYNTARCGSTLLSRCLDELSGVQSISEPDIFTSLTHLAAEAQGSREDDIIALATASTKVLCHLRRRMKPDKDAICLKFRFQMVYMAREIRQAIPDAKSIFLYRNALDVIDSMGAAFISTGAYRVIRAVGLDVLYVFTISTLPSHLWKVMPLWLDDRFPTSCLKPLGAVSPFVMSWISVMDAAIKAKEAGYIQEMIRYEELTLYKAMLVRKVLDLTGMTKEIVMIQAKESDAFSVDAHANSSTRSRRTLYDTTGRVERSQEFAYLHKHEVDLINAVLVRHEIIERSDFLIPGTIVQP